MKQVKLNMPTQKELTAGMKEIKDAWQYKHYPSNYSPTISLCDLYIGCIEDMLTIIKTNVTCPKCKQLMK